MRKRDHRFDDRRIVAIERHIVDEGTVDFQGVDREIGSFQQIVANLVAKAVVDELEITGWRWTGVQLIDANQLFNQPWSLDSIQP